METIPSDGSRAASASPDPVAPGDWPVVPPVPTPTPPAPADPGPEPIIRASAPPGAVPRSGPVFSRAPMRPITAVALRALRPRRPVTVRRPDPLVWPPRFAWITAVLVMIAFIAVTLPLWLALYRTAGSPETHVTEVLALGMVLLGALLSAVAAWVVMVEMRARVRMVDALGEVGAYEAPGPGDASLAGLIRPFVPVPAQLGLLVVALCLFITATVIGVN